MIAPTVKVDFRTRVIAFANRSEAEQEAAGWRADGARARIIVRNGVANVLVAA